MKKAIVKSFMVAFVLLGFVNYFIYLQTGQLPFKKVTESLSNVSFSVPTLEDLDPTDALGKITKGEGADLLPSGQTKIHKWVDEKGVVHYSETPPENLQTQEMVIDSNTNLVKGLAPEEYTTAQEQTPGGRSVLLSESNNEKKAGIDPDSPPIEQALQAKKMMEDRAIEQKKILESL